jgi:hypothetical protein
MTAITVDRAILEQVLEALEHDGLLKKKQAITALRAALAQQEPLAGMSEMNRTIAYCAAAKLRELGYEWDGQAWAALAQQEPDLRNANPIGLTPPQKALQQAQFRADALAQQEQEPGVCGRCGGLVYDPVVAQQEQEQEQEQEPVASAWIHDGVMVNAFPWPPGDPRGCDGDQYWQGKGYAASPLYAAPPRREWKSLSKEEIHAALPHEPGDLDFVCARAVEAKLKERNND